MNANERNALAAARDEAHAALVINHLPGMTIQAAGVDASAPTVISSACCTPQGHAAATPPGESKRTNSR